MILHQHGPMKRVLLVRAIHLQQLLFFTPSLHELVIATVLCAMPVKALLGSTIQAQRWNCLSHFVQLESVGELSQS